MHPNFKLEDAVIIICDEGNGRNGYHIRHIENATTEDFAKRICGLVSEISLAYALDEDDVWLVVEEQRNLLQNPAKECDSAAHKLKN